MSKLAALRAIGLQMKQPILVLRFASKFAEYFLPTIKQAISLQSHLIRFFVEQVGFSSLWEDELTERTDDFSSGSSILTR